MVSRATSHRHRRCWTEKKKAAAAHTLSPAQMSRHLIAPSAPVSVFLLRRSVRPPQSSAVALFEEKKKIPFSLVTKKKGNGKHSRHFPKDYHRLVVEREYGRSSKTQDARPWPYMAILVRGAREEKENTHRHTLHT